ncbi:MAG: flagellar basal body protein [Planctomycetes bacterium]|nr:flagellar basal body protein [Planctomycetota bacterium]
MSVNALNSGYSGMRVNQLRTDVAANNLANANTENFRSSQVATADSAYINEIGQATQATATYAPPRPGAVAPAQGGDDVSFSSGYAETSNTDPANERINQMSASAAYGLNAAAVRTADQMNGTLIDLQG